MTETTPTPIEPTVSRRLRPTADGGQTRRYALGDLDIDTWAFGRTGNRAVEAHLHRADDVAVTDLGGRGESFSVTITRRDRDERVRSEIVGYLPREVAETLRDSLSAALDGAREGVAV